MSETETTTATTDVAMLDTLDAAGREVAVTSMLDQARQWLERAKESTTPAQDVAEFKAFVATVAEAAKQKKLSEDIQMDAVEMLRRSERALGVAIRQGQEAGEIRKAGENLQVHLPGVLGAVPRSSHHEILDDGKRSASEFFSNGQIRSETYAMANQVTDEQFDEVLEAAREEGNLSRRNIVAKVEELSTYREQQSDKWATVQEMAAQGYTSPQIAKKVGLSEDGLRAGARKKGIKFPADKLATGRIDPLYVIEQIVLGIEVSQSSLEVVTFEGVTPQQAAEWLERLTAPLRAVKRMQAQLKEISNG